MLGVERVKHISLVGTAPILVEKGGKHGVKETHIQHSDLWQ